MALAMDELTPERAIRLGRPMKKGSGKLPFLLSVVS
jgi:hypothetical protein